MSISERVVYIQQQEGFTASQFAEILGVQRSGLSHIYSGRNKPSIDFITKLIEHFPDYSAKWILTGQKPEKIVQSQPDTPGKNATKSEQPGNESPNLFSAVESEDPAEYGLSPKSNIEPKPEKKSQKEQSPASDNTSKTIKQLIMIYDDHTFDVFNYKSHK